MYLVNCERKSARNMMPLRNETKHYGNESFGKWHSLMWLKAQEVPNFKYYSLFVECESHKQ